MIEPRICLRTADGVNIACVRPGVECGECDVVGGGKKEKKEREMK